MARAAKTKTKASEAPVETITAWKGFSADLSSKLEITGAKSAAAAVGPNSTVKAVAGTTIAICEYDRKRNPIGFATGIVGKDDVPADTWLIAKNGKLVEAK